MTENRLYEMIYEIYEAIRDDICDRVDESADSWIRCRTSITNEELSSVYSCFPRAKQPSAVFSCPHTEHKKSLPGPMVPAGKAAFIPYANSATT